ncbi:N-acylneuraminate-9-phosphate synthase [Candidatus Uhrbacteria bacterium]|nr:N-acylneuraminate-9-phosphate synthase [Candidatus Uhrbacteria bacterium]
MFLINTNLKRLIGALPHRVKIDRQYVGPGESVYVIAEIGLNHNGDIELAKKLITEAKIAGADAVKFQKRTTQDILTQAALQAPYTSPSAMAPTYGEHREKLEFNLDQYKELLAFANQLGVTFFASVWDQRSADLMEEIGIHAYKVPSADLTNLPLLEYVAKKNKPILISTGMCTLDEIDEAVETVLRFNPRLIVNHCVSLYPCPEDKLNLKALPMLADRYRPLPLGYSGHETTLEPTLAAVAMGACLVERHITLDRTMRGPDHKASLEIPELAKLVTDIRRLEKSFGQPIKLIYPEEVPMREKLAKSIVARDFIPAGTSITMDMLTLKSPAKGLMARSLPILVGRKTKQDIQSDTLITFDLLD